MGLGTLLGGKALNELLRLSPQIITTAEKVYSTISQNRHKGIVTESPVTARVNRLESAYIAQTEAMEQMAGQIKTLSAVIEQLASRTRQVTIIAVIAGSLSVLSLLLYLVRWLSR